MNQVKNKKKQIGLVVRGTEYIIAAGDEIHCTENLYIMPDRPSGKEVKIGGGGQNTAVGNEVGEFFAG
jgi:hypothetical protein